jgi:hypothetical protein
VASGRDVDSLTNRCKILPVISILFSFSFCCCSGALSDEEASCDGEAFSPCDCEAGALRVEKELDVDAEVDGCEEEEVAV